MMPAMLIAAAPEDNGPAGTSGCALTSAAPGFIHGSPSNREFNVRSGQAGRSRQIQGDPDPPSPRDGVFFVSGKVGVVDATSTCRSSAFTP